MTPHFCLQCGTQLVWRTLPNDPRPREVCPACGWVYYPHRKVSAGVVVEQDGRLLLLQRNIPPWEGHWYLPAGYVEVDETPEDAAARETAEECGLRVQVGPLVAVYAYDDDPRGNGLLILYRAVVIGGALRPSAEVRAARFFARDEIPPALAGGAHDRAIRAWQQGRLAVAGR